MPFVEITEETRYGVWSNDTQAWYHQRPLLKEEALKLTHDLNTGSVHHVIRPIKEKTMTTNIFEYAARNKLRFQSTKGELTLEQLWDVPLRSKDDFNLNAVAKTASKAWKDISEESFVETAKTPEHVRRATALEVVKHVIDTKLAEELAAKTRADNKIEKEKLLAILAEKQAGKLSELSEKELQKRIAALGE